MKEGGPTFETAEPIPTLEELHAILKEVIGKEYTEVRKREDEKGVYFLEVTIPGEAAGEVTEYQYSRKGLYKECQSLATEIHATYYKDDFPVSGTSVARWIDGKWKILK